MSRKKKIKVVGSTSLDTPAFNSTLCHPSGKIKTYRRGIVNAFMTDEERQKNNEEWFQNMKASAAKYCREEK